MKLSQNLPEFHPDTPIRNLGDGHVLRIADLTCGLSITGITGSGKSSGPGKFIAFGLLAAGMGGAVLCSKPTECDTWVKWAGECGRSSDVVIIDDSGKWSYNFMEAEASRPNEGGGFSVNVVALLSELAAAINAAEGGKESGGDSKFWQDSLSFSISQLVDLVMLAGLQVSLPLLYSILNSAPISLAQLEDAKWQETSICAAMLREADKNSAKAGPEARADFEQVNTYFTNDLPLLSEKTKGIIKIMFSMLIKPASRGRCAKSFVQSPTSPRNPRSMGKFPI
jgi:hypothetical protein